MVERGANISIKRQCELIGLPRSTYYFEPAGESEYNLKIMRLIDKQYTKTPFYGARKIAKELCKKGHRVNHKRVARLMRKMGIQAIHPGPKTSKKNLQHKIYPYLLRDLEVTEPNQVWCTDITYIRMRHGFIYLVAVMDWYSRYVLSWEISNTLDDAFCVSALKKALRKAKPKIFNTDQGAQFTGKNFTGVLEEHGIQISMDGRGRHLDNIFIERLWRSVKYEEVYLYEYENVDQAIKGVGRYFNFYNNERLHQTFDYDTPADVYFHWPQRCVA